MVSVTHTYWHATTFLKLLKDTLIFTPMAHISKVPRCVFQKECEYVMEPNQWNQKTGNTD